MNEPKYIVGIDLGTTNCTASYCLSDSIQIEQFNIPQLSAASVQEELPILPSFLYFPLEEELKAGHGRISWDQKGNHCVGAFAKERGAEIPNRVISSAKSWACHAGINRREKILPLFPESQEIALSPVEALAEILRHIRESWDLKHPEAPLEEQQVLVTVPASFDPSARQLIEEACEIAGLPETVLFEEPQAAFYAWLHAHQEQWRTLLKVGDLILVVDIGGGTTDFSLIEVGEENGDLILNRKAVGEHLLLGGDNLDLALAYLAKQKLEEQGHTIDELKFKALIHSCRKAKELLLSENAPSQAEVILQGRGSRLIGGTLKTVFTEEEVSNLLIEGFIPIVSFEERSKVEKQMGIQQIGLPFAKDPRISCQLATFLSMNGGKDSVNQFTLPTAVLFNGGTFKADTLRQRMLDLLNHWAKLLSKPLIKELPGADLDFAVSQGAVAYGLARTGKAIRIRGGTSRSYYIGVEDAVPAVPGIQRPLKAYCIVPFGMEEGSEVELTTYEFVLLLGELATFRFFSYSSETLMDGMKPQAGTVVKNWKEFVELHPVETLLPQERSETVKVRLKSKVTELGVLELWCVAEDGRKWKLEFDIRHKGVACAV